MLFWRNLLLFILPGGLILGLACYMRFWTVMPPEAGPVLELFPPVTAIVGLLLGWRFNRTRVIWMTLLFCLTWLALQTSTAYGREFAITVAPTLLPLNILFLAWCSERGFLTGHGLLRGFLFLVQFGALYWLYQAWPGEVIAFLERPLLPVQITGFPQLTQLALLIQLFCLLALIARYLVKPDALSASFCWGLGAVALGFAWPQEFAFWAGVAGLMMVVALIESGFTMAFNDDLTGLPARRAMNEYLLKVSRHYTVAMVDVDHFKKVNDTHGHDVGDQVLRMVASRLDTVSGGGKVFRYGGEEFAVIFPGKKLDKTLVHLEILRENIARSAFVLRGRHRPKKKPDSNAKANRKAGKQKLEVTVSIGVAERNETNHTAEQVIKAADVSLYKAKKGGRNRICY